MVAVAIHINHRNNLFCCFVLFLFCFCLFFVCVWRVSGVCVCFVCVCFVVVVVVVVSFCFVFDNIIQSKSKNNFNKNYQKKKGNSAVNTKYEEYPVQQFSACSVLYDCTRTFYKMLKNFCRLTEWQIFGYAFLQVNWQITIMHIILPEYILNMKKLMINNVTSVRNRYSLSQ